MRMRIALAVVLLTAGLVWGSDSVRLDATNTNVSSAGSMAPARIDAVSTAPQVLLNRTNSSGLYQMNISDHGHVLTYYHEDNESDNGTHRVESFIIDQKQLIKPEEAERMRREIQEKLDDMKGLFRLSSFPLLLPPEAQEPASGSLHPKQRPHVPAVSDISMEAQMGNDDDS